MRQFFVSLLLVAISFQLGFLYLKDSPKNIGEVAGLMTEQSQPILNSVSVGEGGYYFTIFGYTSPQAEVTFNSQGIYNKTYADSNGYFIFNNLFSPFSPREACLSSKDQFGRISFPVCLAAFPIGYNISIGPILISPTISLNKDYYYFNDQIVLSGQTIPNSVVDLSVFVKNQNNILSKIIKPVEAFTFPELTTKSDSKGNFSLSLPSSNSDTFRLFAQTKFNSSMSPASVKLNYEVMPTWIIIVQFFTFILALIKERFIEITIISEILAILYFILPQFFHHKNMAIILKNDTLPAIPDHYPLMIN